MINQVKEVADLDTNESFIVVFWNVFLWSITLPLFSKPVAKNKLPTIIIHNSNIVLRNLFTPLGFFLKLNTLFNGPNDEVGFASVSYHLRGGTLMA